MSDHTHGGTDAPECTTCRPLTPDEIERLAVGLDGSGDPPDASLEMWGLEAERVAPVVAAMIAAERDALLAKFEALADLFDLADWHGAARDIEATIKEARA